MSVRTLIVDDSMAMQAIIRRRLLADPQTSGGLLVSCAPEAVDEVLALFAREGFGEAAVIGRMDAGTPGVTVRP